MWVVFETFSFVGNLGIGEAGFSFKIEEKLYRTVVTAEELAVDQGINDQVPPFFLDQEVVETATLVCGS